jgi:hypothetical protein
MYTVCALYLSVYMMFVRTVNIFHEACILPGRCHMCVLMGVSNIPKTQRADSCAERKIALFRGAT